MARMEKTNNLPSRVERVGSQSFLGGPRFTDSIVPLCTMFSDECQRMLFDLRLCGYLVSYYDHGYDLMAAYG